MLRKPNACEQPTQADRRLQSPWKVGLHWMLTVPFITQLVVIVGLVGYLSDAHGQRSVEDLTAQLMDAVSQRIEQKLTSYLSKARLANQMNSDAVRRGDLGLDVERLDSQREQYLWQQMQLFDNLTWINLGTEAGNTMGVWRPQAGQPLQFSFSNRSTQYFGHYYATNAQGLRTQRLKIEPPAYDPRVRPWYQEAIAAKQAIWTQIYPGFTPGTVFIAASQPLYDSTGKLLGVSGTDISLSGIQLFLIQNRVSEFGQIFLLERSGLLVASSSHEQPFQRIAGQEPQRLNVLESKTPLMRATAQSLRQQFGDFEAIQQPLDFSFSAQDQSNFVRVVPYAQKPGLDWLIVIVIPESDVMGKIQAGRKVMLGLCFAAMTGVMLLNILIGRRLVQPIRALSLASQKIAQGDFEHQLRDSGIRELSSLSQSFDQMSQELQHSRQQLEEYSRSLEEKVSDRTQALQQEIHSRAAAETALQIANRKLQRLAYLDGLTRIPNRRQFDERLLQEWHRMKRDQQPLSLILCDVDYFKQYNDTYGHQAGDACLCQVAKAIARAARRSTDLPARYGGEEFVMLLSRTEKGGAIAVAQEIQAHLRHLTIPHQSSQISPYVTLSLGVVSRIPTAETAPEQLLEQVDNALYRAKREGRDRIAFFE